MTLARQAVLAVLMLPFLCPASGLDEAAESMLTFDAAGAKTRPVNKVIVLLKTMVSDLEKAAKEDQEIYDKMGCWCVTNEKEKTKSIEDAKVRIGQLEKKIESLTGNSARLDVEIKTLKAEVAAAQAALDKANEIRKKQSEEFTAEEKELMASITALKAAIETIGKHHVSFLQMSGALVQGIAASVEREMQKNAELLKGVLTHRERRVISSFAQKPASHLQVKSSQEYAPQSSQILGILQHMKETFETNLATAQKEEAASQEAFAALKAAKEEIIAASTEQIEIKTGLLANENVKAAEFKTDLGDTEDSLAADQEFLKMLKEKCAVSDEEWDERQKTRADEMKAVSQAIAVLTTDDAHDTFKSTFSLVQTESSTLSVRRTQAANLLKAVSQRVHGPRLALLAVSVKLDAFVKVKKAIDDMVTALLKESEDEIAKKESCTDEIKENEDMIAEKKHEKKGLETKIDDLTIAIKELEASIKTLTSEIAEMKKQAKRAGDDRAIENREFQLSVVDQRETQKLLKQALKVLQGFYKKAAFFQEQKQAPPAGFKAYEKNAKAGGAMQLIMEIIDDAAKMETENTRDEENAQAAYEEFIKRTNMAIESKGKDIVAKSEMLAKAKNEKVDAEDAVDAVTTELEELATTLAELHHECDFLLKNFDIRQEARSEEIEALKQAKAILSGATFKQFLQDA